MPLLDQLSPGSRLLDRRTGRERHLRAIQPLGRVVRLHLNEPRTGTMDTLVLPVEELKDRFRLVFNRTSALSSGHYGEGSYHFIGTSFF